MDISRSQNSRQEYKRNCGTRDQKRNLVLKHFSAICFQEWDRMTPVEGNGLNFIPGANSGPSMEPSKVVGEAQRGQLLFWRQLSLLCLGLNHSVKRPCSERARHRAGCQKNMDCRQGGSKADSKPDQGMATGLPRTVKHGYILYYLGRSCMCQTRKRS